MAKIPLCTSTYRVKAEPAMDDKHPRTAIPAQTVRCVRNEGHPAGAPGAHMGLSKRLDGTTRQERWS